MDNKFFSAINKLINVQKKHKSLIDSEVSSIGIHRTQHRALMYLSKKGNLLSQKELAEHLDITAAAVTQLLQKLEADGYIERNLGEDNRFNEINITEEGKKVVEKTRVLFSKVDSSLFDGFTEEELDTFTFLLEKILDNIKGDTKNEKMV